MLSGILTSVQYTSIRFLVTCGCKKKNNILNISLATVEFVRHFRQNKDLHLFGTFIPQHRKAPYKVQIVKRT